MDNNYGQDPYQGQNYQGGQYQQPYQGSQQYQGGQYQGGQYQQQQYQGAQYQQQYYNNEPQGQPGGNRPNPLQFGTGDLVNNLKDATVHFLLTLLYIVALPFALWCKAVQRLATQFSQSQLRIGKINSPWPFFSFIKSLLLEFIFDGVAFISYPAGVIYAIYQWIDTGYFIVFAGIIVTAYLTPVITSLYRDGFQLFVIYPVRKLISWLCKPAQHLDLNMSKKD